MDANAALHLIYFQFEMFEQPRYNFKVNLKMLFREFLYNRRVCLSWVCGNSWVYMNLHKLQVDFCLGNHITIFCKRWQVERKIRMKHSISRKSLSLNQYFPTYHIGKIWFYLCYNFNQFYSSKSWYNCVSIK